MSAAREPDTSKKTAAGADENFTPGFGLKFLRDGMRSANLVAMFGVDGQPSWNFFENTFSNHIPAARSTLLKLLVDKFATGSNVPQTVGISDFADFHQDGVKAENPLFPFSLQFEPNSAIKAMFTADYTSYFTDQLATIPEGSTLYKVNALSAPEATPVHIGDIVMDSKLTTSFFGDKYLFFKHQDMKEDLAIRPEWTSAVPVTNVLY